MVLKHIGSDDFAARYGGEEFVIILTAKKLEESSEIIGRILKGIAGMPVSEMDGKSITVSIGMHDYRGRIPRAPPFSRRMMPCTKRRRLSRTKLSFSKPASKHLKRLSPDYSCMKI